MLEFSGMGCKAVVINVLPETITKTLAKMRKNRNSQERNRRCKEKPNGNFRTEKYTNRNKKTQQ